MPQTPENQIRTRARNLKIGKCFTSNNWEDTRIATVTVTREHINGNLTVGFFLVDLGLLGVKDASYYFNMPAANFYELKNHQMQGFGIKEISYEFAHNLIYGAVAYAEDYGFKPHKDFEVARYILEEDTEDIPLVEFEFGMDGVPTLFGSPDNPRNQERIHLEKTLGVGNFNFFTVGGFEQDDEVVEDDEGDEFEEDDEFDEDGEFDDDDEFDKDDDDDDMLGGWDDDIEEMGVAGWSTEDWTAYLALPREELSFRVIQYYVDKHFQRQHPELAGHDPLFEIAGTILMAPDEPDELSDGEKKAIKKFVEYNEEDKSEKAFAILKKSVNLFPESILFNKFLLIMTFGNKSTEESYKFFEQLVKKIPDNLVFRNLCAEFFLLKNDFERVPGIYENQTSLDKLYPEKDQMPQSLVVGFCNNYCWYYLEMNDLVHAEPYYQVLNLFADPEVSDNHKETISLVVETKFANLQSVAEDEEE